MSEVDWSVAIFCRNEEDSIVRCLRSVEIACENQSFQCTVIINGSSDNTLKKIINSQIYKNRDYRIYTIAYPDKSNAWNAFIHEIRPSARTFFFVDAYVFVKPNSFRLLADALKRNKQCNAATAVPTVGRSARRLTHDLISGGGIHGGLHALSRPFVERICAHGHRLPIGLYRGDGLIGAMAMRDLDAVGQQWCPDRVAVVPEATWDQRTLSVFRLQDLARQYNRMVQQARGEFENAAIKFIASRGGYGALPDYADDMILGWLDRTDPAERHKYLLSPLAWVALARMRRRKQPPATDLMAHSLDSLD